MINICKILVRKPEVKRPVLEPGCFKKIGCEGMD
jgi:hypothetical protein